jgi:thiamine-monophosphate kinase
MERELLDWLRARLPKSRRTVLGVGDDAAILRPTPSKELIVTTDMLMEGVDFVLAENEPELIGRKALAVNLSDLAAMAAEPVAAFASVALPNSMSVETAQRICEGMIALAEEFNVELAGGDTNTWSGQLCLSITALGETPPGRAWRRSGARPGDLLLATGAFGGSLLARHLHFIPRIREALLLAGDYDIHAAMDVSDGLSLDLSRLARESGCGAVLELNAVPIHDDAYRAARIQLGEESSDSLSPTAKSVLLNSKNRTPLEHALGDGEDFELLLAVAPDVAERLLVSQPLEVQLTRIGRFLEQPGLFADLEGEIVPLEPRGYEHGGG